MPQTALIDLYMINGVTGKKLAEMTGSELEALSLLVIRWLSKLLPS